ncbi:BnaC03g77090D [Brassica napus]|uniref:BnaC03g77090D protein n=1 Tax=Brassica napus TaxID=3708 RepID=A0A078IPJ6_BRANA|nr:BnaC03g77090D [Brassica napus]
MRTKKIVIDYSVILCFWSNHLMLKVLFILANQRKMFKIYSKRRDQHDRV